MKKVIISVILLVVIFYLLNNKIQQNKSPDLPMVESYPWQITLLPDGRTRIFGIVPEETPLKKVDQLLNSRPEIAVFESEKKSSLEAYYKNVSLAGLVGSFIFTLETSAEQIEKIKQQSSKKKRTETNSIKYELDKPTSDKVKVYAVRDFIYIPLVQLDEETIVKRFGQPTHKIKLKTKEVGWHYLYEEKGLDLIYKKEDKEVLQYVSPKKFNELLEPLQSDQNLQH